MASLDTNVLVRWLTGDDPKQTEAVRRVLLAASERHEPLFVPTTVMLELEWVLRSKYAYAKADVLRAFNALLEARELMFQDEGALERALHAHRQGRADFADALHVGLATVAGHGPLLTFDAKAARLDGGQLLA